MFLEEGADVNSVSKGLNPLMAAVLDGCDPKIVKSLATSPGVMIDAQASVWYDNYVEIAYLNCTLFRTCLAMRMQCKIHILATDRLQYTVHDHCAREANSKHKLCSCMGKQEGKQ